MGFLLNPRQVITDAMSLAHANAVLCLELVKGKPSVGTNLTNNAPVQLGLPVLFRCLPVVLIAYGFGYAFPAAVEASIAFNHIPHIVGLSSKNDMLRVDAAPVITGMAADQSIWNLSFEKDMNNLSTIPGATMLNKFETGIAASIEFLEFPTSIVADDVVSMESLNKSITLHGSIPSGEFPAQYTGKGGYFGR